MRQFAIVLAGHGPFPEALRSCAELICGPLANISAVPLSPSQTPEGYARALARVIPARRPTLILCDLRGGTPFNVTSVLAHRSPSLVCLSGANLAMVLEAATAQGGLDEALVNRLLAVGRKDIASTSA